MNLQNGSRLGPYEIVAPAHRQGIVHRDLKPGNVMITRMSQIQPLTPPAFEHVVKKCLEKDPDDRWQSARDIAAERRWISETGSNAGVAAPLLARRKRRERALWIAGLVVAAQDRLGDGDPGRLHHSAHQEPLRSAAACRRSGRSAAASRRTPG